MSEIALATAMLLIGIIIGQISALQRLHRRYGVDWEEPFCQWLDRQQEKLEYYSQLRNSMARR